MDDSVLIDDVWNSVCLNIRNEIGNSATESWIAPLVVVGFETGVLYIAAPSAFFKDWVTNNYAETILAMCQKETKEIQSLDIIVKESQARSQKNHSSSLGDNTRKFAAISLPLDPKLTFQNFVVGRPNELAYAAAMRIAESDKVAFNPLFLYGGVGLGKTHLMHAIAWSIKEKFPKRNIAYISAEKFMYQFIKAVRYKDTMSFKEQFRAVDVLMIDDIQFICGKDSTQEEFFHTFNALVDNNRQVIVSADKSPSDLDGMEERLKSRLGWGLVADIHPTNYELRLSILQSKASAFQIKIPNKVLEFIAHKVVSNVRELEGALNRVTASAELVGREITVESAREVLTDLLRTSEKKVTIEMIQKNVAAHYSIKLADMSSTRRDKRVALPRQVAMYLSKKLTSMSLPEIGKNFGDRDHSTVLHGVKKITKVMTEDASIKEDIDLLTNILTK